MMAGKRADRRANGQRANAGTCPLPARNGNRMRAAENRRANPPFARTPSENRIGMRAGSGQRAAPTGRGGFCPPAPRARRNDGDAMRLGLIQQAEA